MEQVHIKKTCPQCKEEKVLTSSGYCSECYSTYKKHWDIENKEYIREYQRNWVSNNKDKVQEYREARLQDTIYMFVPTNEMYEGEVLNIGSTTDMMNRMSSHIHGRTKAGELLKDIEYNIVYAEVQGLRDRQELYFIEYYLIHKYYSMFDKNPMANERDTFNHNICGSRQFELILIAENLRFKEYDVFRHKKNAF